MNEFMFFMMSNQFVLEYFLAACLLAPWKEKRKFWYLTLPLYFLTYLITISPLPEIYVYPILYAILAIIFFSSFKINIFQTIFYATDAYALQFTISSLYYLHTPTLYEMMNSYINAQNLKIFIFTIVIYVLIYFLIVKQRKGRAITFQYPWMIFTTTFGLLVFIYLSYFYKQDYKRFNNDVSTINIVQFLFAFCGLMILVLDNFNCQHKKVIDEQKVLELIIKKDKAQYEQTKKLIERINIKEHDLRRKMEASKLSEEEKEELEDIQSFKICKFTTGNESIDVVLSEYSYICNGKKIQMLCDIDGSQLDFMKPYHIASLFNNALSNAVNYLDKINDEDKKIIRISLQKYNENILLVFQNYLEDKLKSVDSLPITTNEDKTMHGYGLKSIKHITSLYDGYLTIQRNNEQFSLRILFQ